MYINFWYPIGTSEEIKDDEPFRTQIFGLKFVAFRGQDGAAHVLSDTCVHRGGSLGKGWVKDDCVVCPYHGWRFGGDGKCQTVPSIGYDGKPPARAKVDSYPVQEKYGIVFAFLGDLPDDERPSLYEIPEYEKEGWRANDLVVIDIDYYYERSIENGLDPAHNEFVHPTHGYSGERGDYSVPPYEVEEWPLGCFFSNTFKSQGFKDESAKKMRAGMSESRASSGTHGPNVLVTHIDFSETSGVHQYFFEAPVDEQRTRIFFHNLRNRATEPEYDAEVMKKNMTVINQDVDVLSELNPVRTPENNTKEILLPADKCIASYREWLQSFENKGWRIDLATLRDKRGDVAFAVPCPERHTSGNGFSTPYRWFQEAPSGKRQNRIASLIRRFPCRMN